MNGFPPSACAQLDQDVASLSERLDNLIRSYVGASDYAGIPTGEESILFMSQALLTLTSHESCAELLAVAIHRLHCASKTHA